VRDFRRENRSARIDASVARQNPRHRLKEPLRPMFSRKTADLLETGNVSPSIHRRTLNGESTDEPANELAIRQFRQITRLEIRNPNPNPNKFEASNVKIACRFEFRAC